jgi:hypothetical protein
MLDNIIYARAFTSEHMDTLITLSAAKMVRYDSQSFNKSHNNECLLGGMQAEEKFGMLVRHEIFTYAEATI